MTIREDPPPAARMSGQIRYEPVWHGYLAAASADPGNWYRVRGDWDQKQLLHLVKANDGRARWPKLPPGCWEFRAERVPGRPHREHIWARKISEESPREH